MLIPHPHPCGPQQRESKRDTRTHTLTLNVRARPPGSSNKLHERARTLTRGSCPAYNDVEIFVKRT